MCETSDCGLPSRFWVQTNLPADAPHTVPNSIVGPVHPDRNSSTCGRHLTATVRRLHAYSMDYLAGPGAVVAYGWRGLVVKVRDGDVYR